MTFYEELGLEPAASFVEIRQSYKTLCRLLHPDRHPKANAKRMAEYQMRRLNQLMEVLSDPARRRKYDDSIGFDSHTMEAPRSCSIPIPKTPAPRSTGFVWLAAALAGFALVYALVRDDVRTSSLEKTVGLALAAERETPSDGDTRELEDLHKQFDALQHRLIILDGRMVKSRAIPGPKVLNNVVH